MGGGTVQIFFSLWLCSGGYGTAEMVKGVVSVFLAFPSSLLVLLAVGCLAVGILRYIFFVGNFVVLSRGFLFYKLLIVNNLLQVVSQESAS
jgi:hypothetical protein